MRIVIHALLFAVCAAGVYWLSTELGISLYKRSTATESDQASFEFSQMLLWSGVGAVVGGISGYRLQQRSDDDS